MSLRAELLRVGIRLFLKPGLHPGISVAERRRKLGAYEGWIRRPPKGTLSFDLQLGNIPTVRVSRPNAKPGRHVLFLHGGGYITGSPALYRHILWRFAEACQAEIAAVDYRLAPEYPFPAALDDAVMAWRALLSEGADPARCAVLGDSAGGGLALALVLRLRDEGLPLPGAVIAISPWTDLAITGESCRNDAADPMLKSDCLKPFAAQYLQGTDPCHPHASPLYGDPRGLPPTLLQVGSDEILRDDSTRMAERLRAGGCDVTLEVWPRMPHVWHAFAPLMPEATRAIQRIGAFLNDVMARTPARPN
jgi:epsilon-lactone hydrolase